MKKKKLKIGFVGNVNVMPFQYALEFKKKGYDVKYIVESQKKDLLNRPEARYDHIKYPYPKWIIDVSNFINMNYRLIFPSIFARKIITPH